MKTEYQSPEMILAGEVCRDTAVRQAEERAKEEENAVRVRKGRRAGTGMVYGSKKNRRTAATAWRYAAFRKTQPDTMLSLTEQPPKRKEKFKGGII